MRDRLSFLAFLVSLAVLAYGWGAVTVHYELFPYPELTRSNAEVKDFAEYWENDLGITPTRYLVPAQEPANRVGPAGADRAAPGLRVVAGYFRDRPTAQGAALFDERGAELHFWPVDYEAIAAGIGGDYPHARHNFLHGFQVLPDGSVVVSFDSGGVLARLDACGRVLWAIPGGYHHLLNLESDGTLWAVGRPGADLYPNAISRIDPERGELLRTLNFDDELLARIGKGIFYIRRNEDAPEPGWFPDPFHLNDVDILDPSMADAFPLFEAGDIMLSMRSLNLIVVLDADGRRAKWWQHGPWYRQHDPDFEPDGKISVLDNDMHGGVSRIIEIDPVTRETKEVFAGSPQVPFYTWRRGNHQQLDNGNILITESEAGRVFEVDRGGDLVWEYQNRFDEQRNLLVSNAIWLPLDFFEPEAFRCADRIADARTSGFESRNVTLIER